MSPLCPTTELDLARTLMSGQAFRWQKSGDTWCCALAGPSGSGVLQVVEKDGMVEWACMPLSGPAAADYFRLDVEVAALAQEFVRADPGIGPAIAAFPGLRLLRQDPVECLFSFLCSSACPLHRIRAGIDRLCRAYGEAAVATTAEARHFPEVERLADADLDALYATGVGYRARYLQQAAREVRDRGGRAWLLALRGAPYAEARRELLALTGVGEKIADCIALFSLDKDEAVPVDTHIRKVAARYPEASSPKAAYAQVAEAIRDRFGAYAGWAQQYLFFGDLFERGAWGAYARQYDSAVG